jgi:hypothetical protein
MTIKFQEKLMKLIRQLIKADPSQFDHLRDEAKKLLAEYEEKTR